MVLEQLTQKYNCNKKYVENVTQICRKKKCGKNKLSSYFYWYLNRNSFKYIC